MCLANALSHTTHHETIIKQYHDTMICIEGLDDMISCGVLYFVS